MSTDFDFSKWQKLLPAGREDLLTWSALFAGGAINHPFITATLAGVIPNSIPASPEQSAALLTMGFGMTAAVWAGNRLHKRWSEIGVSRVLDAPSKVHIRSDTELPSPETWKNWDGMMLGYCIDSGKPIIVGWDEWMRHCFIIGQSGVGKTVLGEWMMLQQIVRGGSMIFIDGKLDEGNLQKIHMMATWAGRRDDLLVINPGRPERSNSYNPILFGDADEIASRILSLIPSAENNPGADHYRQQANQAVSTLVSGIKSVRENSGINISGLKGSAYNFFDLSLLLQNTKALAELTSKVDANSDAGRQYLSWLEQYKIASKEEGQKPTMDIKKMRDTFGGISGRLYQFGTGNFGKVTASYNPEVNLFEAIKAGKIIYLALPTMGKAEAASNFGKMAVGDYRTAVSWLQDTPKAQRPWPPTLCFFDEAGSYVTQAWARIFEQARSAHQVLVPAVQTMANLEAISPELRAMVVGNTWTKIIFKQGELESAEYLANLIGKEKYGVTSVGYGESESASIQSASAIQGSAGDGQNKTITSKEEEDYRVKPTTLTALGIGEAIVLYANTKLYHIKIPRIEFSKEFEQMVGPFEVNSPTMRRVKGLDFESKLDRYITA